MDVYTGSVVFGGLGLMAMAFGGALRHGGARGHATAHGALGAKVHGGLRSAASGHAHAPHVHAGAHPSSHTRTEHELAPRAELTNVALALLSPRALFSILLGFGTAGVLLGHVLSGWLLLLLALAAGFAFEWLFVRRVWEFGLRFASKPAQTLESAITSEATAVTSFDANGHGIVRLELDGQVIQILATLEPAQRSLQVRAGESVRIESIDVDRNRCTVSLR